MRSGTHAGGELIALPDRLPRTYLLRPRHRWTMAAAGVWLLFCSWFGLDVLPRVLLWIAILAGAACFVSAFSHSWWRWRLTSSLRRFAGAPWRTPGLWDPRGYGLAVPHAPRGRFVLGDWRAIRAIVGAAALVAMSQLPPDWLWRAAAVVAFAGCCILMKPRNVVAVSVEFTRFPYFVGDSAEFRIRIAPHAKTATADNVAVTLRAVAESPVAFGLVWPDVAELFQQSADVGKSGDGAFHAKFGVPSNAPGTDLLAPSPVCWELVVEAASGARRIRASFQVPVYSPPRTD